jgi:hypothetical protein
MLHVLLLFWRMNVSRPVGGMNPSFIDGETAGSHACCQRDLAAEAHEDHSTTLPSISLGERPTQMLGDYARFARVALRSLAGGEGHNEGSDPPLRGHTREQTRVRLATGRGTSAARDKPPPAITNSVKSRSAIERPDSSDRIAHPKTFSSTPACRSCGCAH